MSLDIAKSKTRILILTSTPHDLNKINVERECKEIKKSLDYVGNLDKYQLIQEHATTTDDLYNLLDKFRPNIVHFSGHGERSGIYLQDGNGISKHVAVESLTKLFSRYVDVIECVILNACFSEEQAREIARFVPYVIGTMKEIKDVSAINFSKAFYESFGEGHSFEESFDVGAVRVGLDDPSERNNLVIYHSGERLKIISGGRKGNNMNVDNKEVILSKKTQQILAFTFGALFLCLIIALAIVIPEPTSFQYTVFRVTLAIAGAGCIAMIPGFIEISISTVARVGGSLLLFLIVYFYNPASQIVNKLSDSKPVLNIPRVVDFRTIELGNKSADLVFTSAFSYENEAEPSKTAKVNIEEVDLNINGKKIDLTWRYFVDHNIGRKNGWLGIKGTAAPFSISQGGRNYHETMFVQESAKKVSFEEFVSLLDGYKMSELTIVLSSVTDIGRLEVLCSADIEFYKKAISDYRSNNDQFVNRLTLPCKKKIGINKDEK